MCHMLGCLAGTMTVLYMPTQKPETPRRGRRHGRSGTGSGCSTASSAPSTLTSLLHEFAVYHTHFSILLVKNMLCSKLHCQKGLNPISFSYQMLTPTPQQEGEEARTFRDGKRVLDCLQRSLKIADVCMQVLKTPLFVLCVGWNLLC